MIVGLLLAILSTAVLVQTFRLWMAKIAHERELKAHCASVIKAEANYRKIATELHQLHLGLVVEGKEIEADEWPEFVL